MHLSRPTRTLDARPSRLTLRRISFIIKFEFTSISGTFSREGINEMDIKGLLINVINTRLDANFEARRPAVQAAKDRKAIVEQEMAQLKKDQAALDKKIKKMRKKQAEKIFNLRQAGDYEGSVAAIDEAAFANYKEIAANNAKKAEMKAKTDAVIEEKVAAKEEETKKKAIEFAQKESTAK